MAGRGRVHSARIADEVISREVVKIETGKDLEAALRNPDLVLARHEIGNDIADLTAIFGLVEHESVGSEPAGQCVGTAIADQDVIAVAAINCVVLIVADQRVTETGAEQVLGALLGVAGSITGVVFGAQQIRGYAALGIGIAGSIDPGAAVELVGAAAALEDVVRIVTGQEEEQWMSLDAW